MTDLRATAATPRTRVSLALCGSGGAGVMTAGNMLLDATAKAGWYGLMVRSSGPQVRGGGGARALAVRHLCDRLPRRPLRRAGRDRLAEHPPLRRRDPARWREPDRRRSRPGRAARGIPRPRGALREAPDEAAGEGPPRQLAEHGRARACGGVDRRAD